MGITWSNNWLHDCMGDDMDMIYNNLDMYDTEIKSYGKTYGKHIWDLAPNSNGIMIVKCTKCKEARLFLMGHDKTDCMEYRQ